MVKVNNSMFFAVANASSGKRGGGESVGLLQVDSNHTSILQISELLGSAETAEQSGSVAAAVLAKVKTHGRWTKADQVALKPLITSLVAGFNGQTKKEHDFDQAHWNGEKARQEHCHTIASNKFKKDGEVFDELRRGEKKKNKLKLCHAIDRAWILYEDARQCQASLASMSLGAISVHRSELGSAVESLKTKVDQYQLVSSHGSTNLPSSCTGDQVRTEEQMCLVRRLKRWTCEAQGECTTAVGLANTKMHLKSLQDNRQASKLSFKKVICHVNLVLGLMIDGVWQAEHAQNAADAAAQCDSEKLDADDLVLDLVMPAAEQCNADQDPKVAIFPVETNADQCLAWRDQEYNDWGTDYTTPTDCQATCADAPTATAAPTAAPMLPAPKSVPSGSCSVCQSPPEWKQKIFTGQWSVAYQEGCHNMFLDHHHVPDDAKMIRVTLGNVVDYFMPSGANSMEDMLTHSTKHLFSYDGIWWTEPGYWSVYGGGSSAKWPACCGVATDERFQLTFYGRPGNVCGGGYTDYWNNDFKVEYLK